MSRSKIKRKKQKYLYILSAFLIIASLLSGCSGNAANNADATTAIATTASAAASEATTAAAETTESAAAETTETTLAEGAFPRNALGIPNLGGQTISIWQINHGPDITDNYNDYWAIQNFAEQLNVTFDFIIPAIGQERENFSIMMASNTLPDMIFSKGVDSEYLGGLTAAYADGVLYDYTNDINEINTPNFVKLLADYPERRLSLYDDEGRIVRLGSSIAGSPEADFLYVGPLMREDKLTATGLPSPETMDEWYSVLTAMKANGVKYPLIACDGWWQPLNTFGYAWNINVEGFTVDTAGNVVYGPAQPGYKEYLTTMNKWFSEGLINPDFMNTLPTDAMALFATGEAGAYVCHLYDYMDLYYDSTEKTDPSAAAYPVQLPKVAKSDPLPNVRSSYIGLDNFKYITADAKDPLACVYLLDALYIYEVDISFGFGKEGVSWKPNATGRPDRIPLPVDAPKETLLQGPINWEVWDNPGPEETLKQYGRGSAAAALQLWLKSGTEGSFPSSFVFYNDAESAARSRIDADLKTYVSEMRLKFITGTEPLTNFDAYLAQLTAIGLDEYVAATQSAYSRYLSR
jgi:putative aldouronate transport system substrate-binding protein